MRLERKIDIPFYEAAGIADRRAVATTADVCVCATKVSTYPSQLFLTPRQKEKLLDLAIFY